MLFEKYKMIEIDFINFTPIPSFIGGILIGIAVILFFISSGRFAGVSGMVDSLLDNNKKRFSNFLFLIGLVLGPIIYKLLINEEIIFSITSSIPIIILGGLLVGIGTKIGRGCTSGHGVIGISRFSIRSIVATLNFIFFAMISVIILKLFGIY